MNQHLKKICVFCGSGIGNSPEYEKQAQQLGKHLAKNGITMVFGGGNVGLMGATALAALENSGKVIGIIPELIHKMLKKVNPLPLTETHIVKDMHERKAMMYDLADGFIILPGGIGTIEEFFETYTWYQLGYHNKPIGLLNINDFYEKLITFLKHMIDEGFFRQEYLNQLIIDKDPKQLIQKINQHQPLYIDKLKSSTN
ncbi:MAG: TIGR00730 family Rossman fold protein [Spirochaetes bacterium]|nr:TIGR00730 family Rossman fold protein [Spirochaetota bacterium]